MATRPSLDMLAKFVKERLNSSLILLRETLVDTDSIIGWRQFLIRSDRIGIFGTSCGLIAYSHLAPSDEGVIARIANCLGGLQRPDGGWESLTILPERQPLGLRLRGYGPSPRWAHPK